MRFHSEFPRRVALFTDFGSESLYIGQMKAVLVDLGTVVPVIDLLSDAPRFNPRASAYLLGALARTLAPGVLFLAVVDPGVGGDRDGLIVRNGRHWFVGPDNGLFSQVCRSPDDAEISTIDWVPENCSDSFHGRDIFAPVAVGLCRGESPSGRSRRLHDIVGAEWPEDLAEIVYIDHFGNLLTGLSVGSVDRLKRLRVRGREVEYARTFSEVPRGGLFWYENSLGLVEIAVNQGSAERLLDAAIGDALTFV